MERSNSPPSIASNGSTTFKGSASTFAYQTRLLERRSGLTVLSRNSSTTPPSLSPDATASGKWIPSHRPGNSVDAMRGKWEERARVGTAPERCRSTSPTKAGTNNLVSSPSLNPTVPTAISPTPYKSSYMSKKAYGGLGGRKLGQHLPRIVSGDGDDNQATRIGVAGIPGRMRLSRDQLPSTPISPTPSQRLMRGLWADTQRHLLQAYEYLCHVGEAQQWIEGCLGEELGFGVVEMEEHLRNGVVLAKLTRVFQGERIVRRIYEASKLDFRHSDNINYFLAFVREVGLPECFIFELTDLYEKKNLPKVIYSLHALSHLLSRRGLAHRIGNLVGQLEFSDDQLQKTQKGLNDAGVSMPNFGDVGRELAKEINENPVEVETEDERHHRLLLENEESILSVQCLARRYLARRAHLNQRSELRLAGRCVPSVQALCRGALVRLRISHTCKLIADFAPLATCVQAAARGSIIRKRWNDHVARVQSSVGCVVKFQALARGILQRRRLTDLVAALRNNRHIVTKVQSLARARIARQRAREISKTFARVDISCSVVAAQAVARGFLMRAVIFEQLKRFNLSSSSTVHLQAQCRGVLLRRWIRAQIAELDANSSVVVWMQALIRGSLVRKRMLALFHQLRQAAPIIIGIQAASRTYSVRRRLLVLIRGLHRATPAIVGLQASVRANLSRQHHQIVRKALSEIKLVTSVGSLQARARAVLVRNRHREQQKCLEFVAPDVTGMQAAARGYLSRREYDAWRTHLRKSQAVATILQALLRGALVRRNFREKLEYYHSNLDKVIKIQSLFRAKETREQYRQLTMGKNVTVGTIKNFVHLLDDSEADFQDEIKVERLRKKVVETIRENQALENDVSDLDIKIALVVQNVKSFEELVKVRRKYGADSVAAHATRASILAAHGDPFSGPNTLDLAAKKKLELYQQLFYLLQTKGEYLTGLFTELTRDDSAEKHKPLVERIVLTLFGYGQDRREDYLLLKLFQLSIRQEVISARTIEGIIHGHPMYISIAVQYLRPRQVPHVREALQPIIRELIEAVDLDLESDPSIIYTSRIDIEEVRSGIASNKSRDVSFHEALQDPDTRAEYIRHLQKLQWWSEAFISAILHSAKSVSYAMRFIARETLLALREKFPDAPDTAYAACIARLVYYRYLNPAILAPETFDMISTTVDVAARKNLAQISQVLTQIASGSEFGDDLPRYLPINEMVRRSIAQITAWMLQLADVPDAESHYHADEFLDVTVQPKPIYISPNEVYTMHGLLSKYQEKLSPSRDDDLRIILYDLHGVPHIENDELKDARDKAITLELTNRFAHVRDPQADEKALWVQAKRGLLAILRVQPAQDLVLSLMCPVTEEDEYHWGSIVAEMDHESVNRRMPSTSGGDASYRLEDVRLLQFKEVKARTIFYLLELEKQGKITRDDGFRGVLNAIASDIRSKHRKRLQRQQEMDSMMDALKHLNERKKYFQEQIDSYHNYVETAMATMQRGKGKKRFVLPFTKQYFHLRDLQKSGKNPKFGSFKYSAKDLYEKGILLSVDKFSPRQFDRLDVIISSNKAGIFTMEMINNTLGISNRLAMTDLRMEDLLQAQFESQASLPLFNGLAKVNLSLLLFQINKKFYV